MIYKYENEFGFSISFASDSPYRLKSVDSSSAVDVTIAQAATSNQVGAVVTGQKIEPKTMTFIGDMKRDSQIRRNLLEILITGKGRLTVTIDKEMYYMDVIVERTPSIERVNDLYDEFEFSLFAPYPYWKTLHGDSSEFIEVIPRFSFPKTFKTDEPFYLSERRIEQIQTVRNYSVIPVGFKVIFRATGTVVDPSVTKISTGEFIKFDGLEMSSGDIVEVNTGDGEKRVSLVRGEERKNIFGLLDDDSTFFKLDIGINEIQYEARSGTNLLVTTIENDRVVLGV